MPKSNQDGTNRGNGSTSKQSTDEHRSANSEKGKSGQISQQSQGEKGKEDMRKGKAGSQRNISDSNSSGGEDQH